MINYLDVTKTIKVFNLKSCDEDDFDEFSRVSRGLYVFVFSNIENVAIHDRNVKPADRKSGISSGKIVVDGNSTSIKFGKFEQGFVNRIKGYAKHMHYYGEADQVDGLIFSKVIVRAILLDLTEVELKNHLNSASVFEGLWNGSFAHYLSKYFLGNQRLRSEYRNVVSMSNDELDKLYDFGKLVSEDIRKISNVLK